MVDQAKLELRKKRSAIAKANWKKANAQFVREVKCFWTWPLGHEYEANNCVGCNKKMLRYG